MKISILGAYPVDQAPEPSQHPECLVFINYEPSC
jgi:hypothetical protein